MMWLSGTCDSEGETNVGRRDDAIGGNPIGNIIIDHVSASWGLDENMSFYRHMYDDGTGKPQAEKLPTVNVTIQNSIFQKPSIPGTTLLAVPWG